ncbi:MAG: hypothetical protein HOP15_08810 [Planctomycetes bacterium]|nr:hypothetical protein [Planctomycetota bacterium]
MLPVLLIVLLQAAAPKEAAGSEKPTAQGIPPALRVNRAIALGIDHLRRAQQHDGSFLGYEGEHPGGLTAFVAYTLVKSGVRKDDRMLTRALGALAGREFKSVYSASAHLLLCEAMGGPARVIEAESSLEFLLANREDGVWGYPWGHLCDSNTQFALLALRAARCLGLEVPEEVLIEARAGLELFHDASGGFTYTPGDRVAYAGITAAALASLAVLQEAAGDLARLRAALKRDDDSREEAEEWLEARFDPQRNQYTEGAWTSIWHFAYLWAIERWCGLTQRERIGGRDWYSEGATWLLEMQTRDGSFGGGLADTCFALLFLRRATVTPNAELAEIYAEIDRSRAGHPPAVRSPGDEALRITDWWLAGPWEKAGDQVLLLEPPFDPADLRPRAKEKVARKEWERVALLLARWTDLEKLTGRTGKRQLWVLTTWLCMPEVSEGTPSAALLWLEVDEGWDVLLDGQRLSRERRRTPTVNYVSLPVGLLPGQHQLTVLVEDLRGMAFFGALLTDSIGGPPPVQLSARAERDGSTRR